MEETIIFNEYFNGNGRRTCTEAEKRARGRPMAIPRTGLRKWLRKTVCAPWTGTANRRKG